MGHGYVLGTLGTPNSAFGGLFGGLSDLGPNIYEEDDPTLRIWLNGLRRVFWAQSPSDFFGLGAI